MDTNLDQLIPAVIKRGYNGVFVTEFEGRRWIQDVLPFSAIELIDRHQVIMRHLLRKI